MFVNWRNRTNDILFENGIDVDHIDRHILALLQENARLAYQEIGDAVGLSGPAAFQRVRKLEAGGVVTGYHAAVDPVAVGRTVVAFVRVVPGPSADTARLRDTWASMAEIQECHLLSGQVGYLLKVQASAAADLEPLLDAARRAGCEVRVELALTTVLDRRRVPVF